MLFSLDPQKVTPTTSNPIRHSTTGQTHPTNHHHHNSQHVERRVSRKNSKSPHNPTTPHMAVAQAISPTGTNQAEHMVRTDVKKKPWWKRIFAICGSGDEI